MNGTSKGYFQLSWRLRQGDPLSLYLFIIVEEVLSHLLNKSAKYGKILDYKTHRGWIRISHLLYLDDQMLFLNGSKKYLKARMDTLRLYENISGQKVKHTKYAMYFAKYTFTSRKTIGLQTTGFHEGSFPYLYLGARICIDSIWAIHLEPLIQIVQMKSASWKVTL